MDDLGVGDDECGSTTVGKEVELKDRAQRVGQAIKVLMKATMLLVESEESFAIAPEEGADACSGHVGEWARNEVGGGDIGKPADSERG
jgi:hypothetical protein